MEGERNDLLLPASRVGQAPVTCYPGLVQPYKPATSSLGQLAITEQVDDRREDRSCTTSAGMNQPRGNMMCDPFSIYDDDCGEDHYYLMPKMAGDVYRNEWNKTVKNSRSLRALKTMDVKLSDSKGRTRSFPPCGQRSSATKTRAKSLAKESGEYCSISATEKNPPGLRTPIRSVKSLHGCKDRESLRDFASRLVVNDLNENQSSRNSLHSFEQRKTRAACVAMNDVDDFAGNDRCGQTSYTVDDMIDYCTCMFCIKGLFYHCTKDSDGETIEDPCSCTGGPGSSTLRIVCLGLLTCLLPCMACYLPARGCLRLCRNCTSSKKKDKKRHLNVRYHKELRDSNTTEARYV